MPEVDVSKQALIEIRHALVAFQGEITGMGARARQCAAEGAAAGQQALARVAETIRALEDRIRELEAEIRQLEAAIAGLEREIRETESEISGLNGRIATLQGEMGRLQEQRSSLQRADPDDKGAAHRAQAVDRGIEQCQREMSDARARVGELEQQKAGLERALASAQSRKRDCEAERERQKRRLQKYQDKQERLKAAVAALNADLEAFAATGGRVEGSATDFATGSRSAVAACIDAVDRYMDVQL